jgi:hypothetical protein
VRAHTGRVFLINSETRKSKRQGFRATPAYLVRNSQLTISTCQRQHHSHSTSALFESLVTTTSQPPYWQTLPIASPGRAVKHCCLDLSGKPEAERWKPIATRLMISPRPSEESTSVNHCHTRGTTLPHLLQRPLLPFSPLTPHIKCSSLYLSKPSPTRQCRPGPRSEPSMSAMLNEQPAGQMIQP